MDSKAKVVLTDYVWESLAVEKKMLEGVADLGAPPNEETRGVSAASGGL